MVKSERQKFFENYSALSRIFLSCNATCCAKGEIIVGHHHNLLQTTGYLCYVPQYVTLRGMFCFAPQSAVLNWTTQSFLATTICCAQQDIFVTYHNLLLSTGYLFWAPQSVALNGISLFGSIICCTQLNIFVGHHNLLRSTEYLCWPPQSVALN